MGDEPRYIQVATREEFLEIVARYTLAITTPPYNAIDTGNALLAAYDALVARIAELEAALAMIRSEE